MLCVSTPSHPHHHVNVPAGPGQSWSQSSDISLGQGLGSADSVYVRGANGGTESEVPTVLQCSGANSEHRGADPSNSGGIPGGHRGAEVPTEACLERSADPSNSGGIPGGHRGAEVPTEACLERSATVGTLSVYYVRGPGANAGTEFCILCFDSAARPRAACS